MTTAGDKITIVGGGHDIWDNSDNFHFAFMTVTGDFDYVVKVEDLQGPDNWSKAELMARQSDPVFGPEGGDPHISNMTTRSGGQNQLAPQWRIDLGGGSAWVSPPGAPAPTYPNTWLRLERVGSVFYLYYGSDGVNWTQYENVGKIDTSGADPIPGVTPFFADAWPETILLGLAVTAHNDGDADGATAVFSNFKEYVPVPISITTQPAATVSVSANNALVLSVEATGDPVHHQWRKNGADIAGATAATYQIDLAKLTDSGTYSVRLFGAGKEVISANSVVTVTADTEAPTIASANPDETFTAVLVKYSEPVDASAESSANYSLDNGTTISSEARVDEFTVQLTTSRLAEGAEFTLTVNNVKDTASPANTIAANTKATFKSFIFAEGFVLHKFWADNTANNIDALLNDPRFPNAPSWVTIEPMWEYGPGGNNESGSNYGNQLVGWFIPPQTGNFVFFTNSDDPSNLYLSPDDNPENKRLIAQEASWSNARNWVSAGGGSSSIDDKRSDLFLNSEWTDFSGGFGIPLQTGQRYYLESVHTEGGGGDSVAATFILEGDPDPVNGDAPKLTGSVIGAYLNPNGASVTITAQPQSITVGENREGTLTADATGTSAYGSTVTYQWQSAPKGSTTFTDIAGATAASYTTPLLTSANDGSQYRVIARVPTTNATSDPAIVTVSSDQTPPALVSAGAIKGDNQVGVAFDELLDPASAQTAGNYQVSGASVTGATLRVGKVVQLDLSSPVPASFTVTVNSVKDAAGNAVANATVNGEVVNMTAGDIGDPGVDPLLEGGAFAYGKGGFYVAGGGHDIWDNADGFQFVYQQFTGAFDMRANVVSLGGTHQWAKAELMARESLDGGSRHADVAATRSDGNGQNQLTWQWRDTTDGGSGSLDGALRTNLRDNADYPNTWIRLVREDAASNDFKAYWSNDGSNWILHSSHTIPSTDEPVLPETLYVGMAVTSHDNGDATPLAEAVYGSFSVNPYEEITDPQLKAALQGGQVVISWASGTLVSSPDVTGPYTSVAGANSPYSVTPQSGAKFYKVQQ